MTTERDVAAALYAHFTGRWAVVTQVTAWCAESRRDRRCDVLLYKPTERIAVEVKVSRADLVADVRDPAKQAAWRALTHRHAYAAPPSLRDAAMALVPRESGVIVVHPDRSAWPHQRAQFVRKCPRIPGKVTDDLPARVWWTLTLRLAQAEANAKGLVPHHGTDDPGELRAQIARLQRDLEVAHGRTDDARQRAEDWRKRYAALDPPSCRWCGGLLAPEHGRARAWTAGWRHTDPVDATRCETLREAVAAPLYDGGRPVAPHPEPADPVPA